MRFISLILACLALAACGSKPVSPILRTPLRQVNPDGTTTTLNEKSLTSFQRLIRSRISAGPASSAAAVHELYALEVDVPEGDGHEGAYVAVVDNGKSAEYFYFEQAHHLPRSDRYFHRTLTPEERNEFLAFAHTHPTAALRIIRHSPVLDTAAHPDTPAPPPTDTENPGIVFRFTVAQPKQASTIELTDPTPDDHPAIDLITLFSRLRDQVPPAPHAPLACTYFQPIPSSARILFADPERHVLSLWTGKSEAGEEELRALISPPLSSATTSAPSTAPSPEVSSSPPIAPDEKWYVWQNNNWSPSEPPPPPPPPAAATQASTQPTTQAATRPVSLTNTPLTLPSAEVWSAEPGEHSTNVWHYLPADRTHGQWLGFVVPNLIFDDEHAAISPDHQTLYLIHDGQLLSLPVPSTVLVLKK